MFVRCGVLHAMHPVGAFRCSRERRVAGLFILMWGDLSILRLFEMQAVVCLSISSGEITYFVESERVLSISLFAKMTREEG